MGDGEGADRPHHISAIAHHFLADDGSALAESIPSRVRATGASPPLHFAVAAASAKDLSAFMVARLRSSAVPGAVWRDLGAAVPFVISRLESSFCSQRADCGPREGCDGLIWCVHARDAGSLCAAHALGRLAWTIGPAQIVVVLFPAAERCEAGNRVIATRGLNADSADRGADSAASLLARCRDLAAAAAPRIPCEILTLPGATLWAPERWPGRQENSESMVLQRLAERMRIVASGRDRGISAEGVGPAGRQQFRQDIDRIQSS